MFELSIKVKGEDQTLTDKHLVYEKGVTLSKDDQVLHGLVTEIIKRFKATGCEPEDVQIKIKMDW